MKKNIFLSVCLLFSLTSMHLSGSIDSSDEQIPFISWAYERAKQGTEEVVSCGVWFSDKAYDQITSAYNKRGDFSVWASEKIEKATQTTSNCAAWASGILSSGSSKADKTTEGKGKIAKVIPLVTDKVKQGMNHIKDKVAGTRFETVFDRATSNPSVNAVGALTGASVFYNAAKKLKGNAFVKGISSLTGAGLGAVSAPAVMAFFEGRIETSKAQVAVLVGALSIIGTSFYVGKTVKKVEIN